MKNPLVSIIIPTYNEEKNIPVLLRSINDQTYKNIETIVVDDDSTDKTVKLAKQYTKKVYPRKRAERSVQRNFGVKKAKGKYVLVLDADMELTPKVVESCIKSIKNHKALIIPEKTTGTGFVAHIRRYEREMYMGDPEIEVARFFDKKVFEEFKGYDENLTGAEDYDLPKRISEKCTIGWSKEYILHHETGLTLLKLLQKKYYYAQKSVAYAEKHPDMIKKQGTILFRKAYLRHWKKFFSKPFTGIAFLFVRVLAMASAIAGYIQAAGFKKFFKTLFTMLRS